MRLFNLVVSFAVCVFTLCACGGGGSTPPGPSPTATPVPASGSNVFVGNPGGLTTVEYGPVGAAPLQTLSTDGPPSSIGFDLAGNIYFADGIHLVDEYAEKTHTLLRKISAFNQARDVALDARNDLYVVDYGLTNNVPTTTNWSLSEFAPGATTPSRVVLSDATGYPGPLLSVALDQAGNAYVGSQSANVAVIAPGATTPSRTLSGTLGASSLAFDAAGNLYVYSVGFSGLGSISVFAAGAGTPSRTISAGIGQPLSAQSLALDSAGNLYVASGNDPLSAFPAGVTPSVTEYAPGGTTPIRTIAPLTNPAAVAVDPLGNVYVLDTTTGGGEHPSEFAATGSAPVRTFASSGNSIGLSQ